MKCKHTDSKLYDIRLFPDCKMEIWECNNCKKYHFKYKDLYEYANS